MEGHEAAGLGPVDAKFAAVETIVAIDAVWGSNFDEAPLEVIHEWSRAMGSLELANAERIAHHEDELPGWLEYATVKGVNVGLPEAEPDENDAVPRMPEHLRLGGTTEEAWLAANRLSDPKVIDQAMRIYREAKAKHSEDGTTLIPKDAHDILVFNGLI